MELKEPILSEEITRFASSIKDAKSLYSYAVEREKDLENEQQDILHYIEFNILTYRQRAKISSILSKIRRERRHMKNICEKYEIIVKFFDSPESKKFMNDLGQVLGKVRKTEKTQNERIYTPRTNILEGIDKNVNG